MASNIVEGSTRLQAPKSWENVGTHFLTVLKSPWYQRIFEFTDIFHRATTDFWRARDGRAAYLPITTGSISSPIGRGSDSTPVRVTVEGVDTYLADSMQFPLELSCRLSDGPTYYVMPSFRGEQADATHLCQFYHSEAELPGDLDAVLILVEDYVRHLSTYFLDNANKLICSMAGTDEHLYRPFDNDAFLRLPFAAAATALNNDPRYILERSEGCRSLTRAGERELMRQFGQFTWVTHMDHLSVPFYQAFVESDRNLSKTGDLLFGVGETVGCGERHATADEVSEAMAMHGVDEDAYQWYLEMRRAVPMRTSGFGMGVERFLLWLLAHDDIRDIPLLLRFNGSQINP